jgi:acetyl esterase/lipase
VRRAALLIAALVAALPVAADAADGPVRERLRERLEARRAERGGGEGDGDLRDLGGGMGAMSCAEWSRRLAPLEARGVGMDGASRPDRADVAYGTHAREKLDVYLAAARGATPAPVIVMVHGGGWCVGDKRGRGVVQNKVARWVPRGFAFISLNYPMVGDGADAIAQAGHVARAVAFVQAQAAGWGADPAKVILMGHSAGAHLVSLVGADAGIRRAAGMKPVLGTVSLDAGAIDVVRQMPNVYPFLKLRYSEAFGESEAGWRAASPFHRIDATAAPWLGVCSTTRKDDPCGQAQAYADKSRGLGVRAAALPEPMNHGRINEALGKDEAYTAAVEDFLAALDAEVAARLRR